MIKTVFFDIGDTLVADRKWMPGARETIKALTDSRIRLGILSNTGNLDREQLGRLLPEDFDFGLFAEELVLLSSETGIEKPGLNAFLLAVQHSGNSPWETMFVGESLDETLAAQRAGMIAARCLNEKDLATVLKIIRDQT